MEKNIIEGYILEYKYKDRKSLALLNHKLFGRLSQRVTKTDTYCYYLKGMLHDTKFCRLRRGRIFMLSDKTLDTETIDIFTRHYKIYKIKINIGSKELLTGLEYWKKHSEKNGVYVDGWGS